MTNNGCAEMVHVALQKRGFSVVEASMAPGVSTRPQGIPDLILCDVNMQNVDGYRTSLRCDDPATIRSRSFL
jgi:CheY-like chemotaxis protein